MKITSLLLIVLYAPAYSQIPGPGDRNKSLKRSDTQRFIGAWHAISITDTAPDGTEVPDLYLGLSRPVGLLIYEATGYMCAGIMNPNRSKGADDSSGTQAEMVAAMKGYDTYCGTYEINEARKTVTHHVRIALVPNDVGGDRVRKYEFHGNELKLSGTDGLKPGFKLWTFRFQKTTPKR